MNDTDPSLSARRSSVSLMAFFGSTSASPASPLLALHTLRGGDLDPEDLCTPGVDHGFRVMSRET